MLEQSQQKKIEMLSYAIGKKKKIINVYQTKRKTDFFFQVSLNYQVSTERPWRLFAISKKLVK